MKCRIRLVMENIFPLQMDKCCLFCFWSYDKGFTYVHLYKSSGQQTEQKRENLDYFSGEERCKCFVR